LRETCKSKAAFGPTRQRPGAWFWGWSETGWTSSIKPFPPCFKIWEGEVNRVEPPAFSHRLYRQRNLVERFFNKLKHFRAVATRYDKRDDNYLASVKLASLRIWLRVNEPVT